MFCHVMSSLLKISLDDFVQPTQLAITTRQYYRQLLTAPGMGKYYCVLTQVHNKCTGTYQDYASYQESLMDLKFWMGPVYS